jgi:serine protease Do
MMKKIPLYTVGIIAGAAAIFAFLFGMIITSSLPIIANKGEASNDRYQTPVPLVNEAGESPFTKIAEIVSPSVVNISAKKTVSQGVPGFDWYFEGPFDDFFKDFFRDQPKQKRKTQTLGSGFILSEDGYIVTNYHVVKGASAEDIEVKLINKKEFKGDQIKIIGTDQRTDIAVLKIQTDEKLPYLKFGDSDNVRVGDWAIAVGNPFHLEGTLTVGVISAKGRTNIPLPEGPDFQSFLQTDAAINPGNSGGPLVNIHGEVVGINTAITTTTGGNMGIGFAIPANLAQYVIDELIDEGKVVRGYLGVYLQEITEDLKQALDLASLDGVLISDVVDNTPASKAGLKSGDVVEEFDGKKVDDLQSFRMQVASTKVGKKVAVKILRDGKTHVVNVTIGEYPDQLSEVDIKDEKQNTLGLTVINVSDMQAQRYNLEASTGVVVISVEPDTPSSDARIAVGDVILAIGKKKIDDIKDYQSEVAKLQDGKPVIFQIQRKERKLYVAVTP